MKLINYIDDSHLLLAEFENGYGIALYSGIQPVSGTSHGCEIEIERDGSDVNLLITLPTGSEITFNEKGCTISFGEVYLEMYDLRFKKYYFPRLNLSIFLKKDVSLKFPWK